MEKVHALLKIGWSHEDAIGKRGQSYMPKQAAIIFEKLGVPKETDTAIN